jgi:hypothetical protein
MKIQFATLLPCIVVASTAKAQAIKPAVPDVARPIPLSSVRLTGGPLKRAQDLSQKRRAIPVGMAMAEILLDTSPDIISRVCH